MITKQQFGVIITALKGNYRNFGVTDKAQFEFWYSMLNDISYETLQMAVKKLICEFTYPPTIADIRKRCAEVVGGNTVEPIELWDKAIRMIRKGSILTQEEFDAADPTVKKYFGNIASVKEHSQMDVAIVNSVIKGQFLKQVQSLNTAEKANNQLPEELKKILGNVGKPMLKE